MRIENSKDTQLRMGGKGLEKINTGGKGLHRGEGGPNANSHKSLQHVKMLI